MPEIDQERYELMYHEVGRLTRALHNAIRDFHLDIGLPGDTTVEHELSEMADARSRLNYVITMTEDAANMTMDKVDEAAPVIQGLVNQSAELLPDWQAYIASRPSDPAEQALYARVSALLDNVGTQGGGIHERLTDILMAQGYQDLSGQVIKRVINLVSDVEKSLVRLVKLAGSVEQAAGIAPVAAVKVTDDGQSEQQRIRAEGPQTGVRQKQDVVSGQDDVDDLLSSLGF